MASAMPTWLHDQLSIIAECPPPQGDLQLVGLELPSPLAPLQYILCHTQELALDPRPLIAEWQAASGQLQLALVPAADMGQLEPGTHRGGHPTPLYTPSVRPEQACC